MQVLARSGGDTLKMSIIAWDGDLQKPAETAIGWKPEMTV
jgi:hypothetical protein